MVWYGIVGFNVLPDTL